MKLSIVVPCYNEAENIPLLLKRFSDVIVSRNIEVILVNNGSTDNSMEVLNKILPTYNFAKTINVPVNQGYGYGILQGLKNADGQYIGWTHADMQTDPADIVEAFDIIMKNLTEDRIFLKGTRKGRPIVDEIFTRGMSIFESIYFKMPLWDINAQPNIFSRDFFETWENPPKDFSLDLYALYRARKQKFKIIRFPVKFPRRLRGESKWNNGSLKSKIKFIRQTVKFSIELKQRKELL